MSAKRNFTLIYMGLVILSLVSLLFWSYISLAQARTIGHDRLDQNLTAMRMALANSYSVEAEGFQSADVENFLQKFPNVLLMAIYDAERLESIIEREHQAVMVHLERSRNTRYAINPLTQARLRTTITTPDQRMLEVDMVYALITTQDILRTANHTLYGLLVMIVLTLIVFIFIRLDGKQKKTAYAVNSEYTPLEEEQENDSLFFEKESFMEETSKFTFLDPSSPLNSVNFTTEMVDDEIESFNAPMIDLEEDLNDSSRPKNQLLEFVREALQRADGTNNELSVWFCEQQDGDDHFEQALTQLLLQKIPSALVNKENLGYQIFIEQQNKTDIKQLINQLYISLCQQGYHLVSGVSSRNQRQVSAQLLLREAKAAFTIAQETGEKNRVVFFKPDPVRFKQLGL
jgi:hypothetical protein